MVKSVWNRQIWWRTPSYVELARNCDIILSGHTHGEEQFEPDKKYAGAWLFKAGAIFDKDPLIYNCEILKINIKNRSIYCRKK